MVVDERSRHALHTELERLLGADHADTMMSMLPPVGWADVATKRDLDAFATSIRLELHTEISGVRGEIAGLRDEVHTGLAEVRTELHREISQMTRTMVFSMTGALAAMGGLAFAAASLV